ncbi:TPA: Arc family DNA-binding protein [Escherichia coli]|nr:Arc family DNA-binding protein [Escherichia coli]
MKVRDIAPLGIRIPPEIKEKLKEKAKEEGRSLNSEIVQRLIRSLKVCQRYFGNRNTFCWR